MQEPETQGFLQLSASEMVRALGDRQLSSEELTNAVLTQIEAANHRLNAMVTLDAEAALATARAYDRRRVKGEQVGPLAGLPMTVKDSFETAGIVSTAGTSGRRDFVPARDATVVGRLRAAGAIIVGKTNTPELTLRFTTENEIMGRTNNPYDLTRSPGGSSGGAASMISAAATPLDIGSDTGGSIRIPSHFCGIAGLKPTAGRVSRAGHVPHLEFPLAEAFTQVGPLARYVSDLRLVYPIMAGADPRDPFCAPMPINLQEHNMHGLKIGFYTDNGCTAITSETADTLRATATAFADAGAHIEDVAPPGLDRSTDLWREIFLADGGEAVRAALRHYGTESMSPLLAWTQGHRLLSTSDLSNLLGEWADLKVRSLAFMASYDLLLCPVNGTPAPRHDAPCPMDYTYHYNLLGWPVAVVRCGASASGLPIGMQLVANPWREDVCLSAAQFLEDAMGGYQKP